MMIKETLDFLVAKTKRNAHFSKMPLSYLLIFPNNASLNTTKQIPQNLWNIIKR